MDQEAKKGKASGFFSLDVNDEKLERLQKYLLVFSLVVSYYCIGVLFQRYADLSEQYRSDMRNVLMENSVVMRELKEEIKKGR